MENREAVNIEFDFKRHKNKSKLRENELLEALSEKEKEVAKLEKSLNALTTQRLQNAKEELLQKSLNECEADENGKVCIKCDDLEKLLEENKKVIKEFEKLTLEYENLKLNYIEIEKENETNKLKIIQLEKIQEKEKAESEKLLEDIQKLRETLQNVQEEFKNLNIKNSSKNEECTALSRQVQLAREDMVLLEEKFRKLETSWQEQQQTLSDIETQYANVQTKYEHLQSQYEQLKVTRGQSETDCRRLEKENIELQTEIEDLKKKVKDAQQKLLESNEKFEVSRKEVETVNEENLSVSSKIQEENQALKNQLSEIQIQIEGLQKDYDILSNQLMDSLQENESLKNENTKIQEKLKEYEIKNQELFKTEAEVNELKLQLENVLLSESKEVLKTPSPCRNSSMRSSGVCVTEENDEDLEDYNEELFRKFSELSESLTEIELEHTIGKTKIFKSASKNSTPNYKMYLKNILGVRKSQKDFEMEIENIHLQGSFKHHSFHIVELSGEVECDNIDINGCDNITEYIENLKQEIADLKACNEQERLSNKSMLESTERALIEMREQIQHLSAELLEKSIFVENCACKTYQQQIESLEKEKANITIVYEELQSKVNCTLNESLNNLVNTTCSNEEKNVAEQLESYDSQTKMLEELTQRYIDMESDLQTAKEQIEKKDKEYKEKLDQLQLDFLEKLEISANEYRDNMKKYNKDWEDKKEEYEQIIKDLEQQIEQLKLLVPYNKDLNISKEVQQEDNGKEGKDNDSQKHNIIEDDNKKDLELQLHLLEEEFETVKQKNSKYMEEIPLLNSKIDTLQEQLKTSLHNNAILSSEKDCLEAQVKDLEHKLKCAQQLNDKNQEFAKQVKVKIDNMDAKSNLFEAELQINELCKEDLNQNEIIQTFLYQLSILEAKENEKKLIANKVETLQKECSKLQDSLNSLQDREQNLLRENEDLKQEKLTLQEDFEKLSTNQSELLLKKCTLEEKLQDIMSEMNLQKANGVLLENQLRELKEDNNNLLQNISTLQEKKCNLEEQLKCQRENEKNDELLEQVIKENTKISQNLRLVTENIAVIQKQLEQKEEEIKKAKEDKDDIEKDLHSLRESLSKTIDEKQQQLMEAEKEKEQIEQDRIKICQDIQELKQTLSKANEEKEEKQNENANLRAELETLKNKISELSNANCEQQLELEKAKENQNTVQKDLESFKDSLTKALTEKQQEFESVKDSYQLVKKDNQELQKEVHNLSAALISSNEDKEQHLKEIEFLEQEHLVAKESIASLTAELQKLQQQLESFKNYKEEYDKLENTLNLLKSSQTNALCTLRKERDHLQNTVEQYKQQQKEFKEKEETLNQKIDTLNQQLHEFRSRAQSYIELQLEQEEIETALTTANARNEKLQEEISQLSVKQETYESTIKSLSGEIKVLNLQLSKQLSEKKNLEMKYSQLKDTLQDENSLLQREHQQLKSSLDELQLKHDSLQTTNTQLQTLNHKLQQQIQKISDKLQDLNNIHEEYNTVKNQNIELQRTVKATVEEASRCSLSLREEIEQHKMAMQKQQEGFNKIITEIEVKSQSLEDENVKLSSSIKKLQDEKQILQDKLREITVRNFEQDLQRQVIDATVNTSVDSNTSFSSRGRRSLDNVGGGGGEVKGANTSIEDKPSAIQQKNLTAERKNRRLSAHDERRRQSSYWGVVYDKETMTDPLDTSCNCVELDRKLKESERNLFIKNSQVTVLNMQLKNHPLKEENAVLKKRLQEEQEKHRIEIKRYKNKLKEQTAKAEKSERALAAVKRVTAETMSEATSATDEANQNPSTEVMPKVLADVEVQTDDELSVCLQKLQGKYNDVKNICRYRYNVIKELEEKVAQKENSDGNSLSALEAAQYKILINQCESLKRELKTIKEKYESAKQVLLLRREEIQKLRSQLEEHQ